MFLWLAEGGGRGSISASEGEGEGEGDGDGVAGAEGKAEVVESWEGWGDAGARDVVRWREEGSRGCVLVGGRGEGGETTGFCDVDLGGVRRGWKKFLLWRRVFFL